MKFYVLVKEKNEKEKEIVLKGKSVISTTSRNSFLFPLRSELESFTLPLVFFFFRSSSRDDFLSTVQRITDIDSNHQVMLL